MDRLCINCKYLYSDWHLEPCKSCVTKARPNFEPNNKDETNVITIREQKGLTFHRGPNPAMKRTIMEVE